jgi:hypothetical protein
MGVVFNEKGSYELNFNYQSTEIATQGGIYFQSILGEKHVENMLQGVDNGKVFVMHTNASMIS